MGNYSKIDDSALWELISQHQGEQFSTSGRSKVPGKPFTYTVKGGEIFVSTRAKSITKATVMVAYKKAINLQNLYGYVAGPKSISTFGASYLFPIFVSLGIITRTPLTLFTPADTIEENNGEDKTLPRPKGSKNKKTIEVTMTVEEFDAKIAEMGTAIEALTAELKSRKAELKELTKQKEAAVKAAAAKKAEEDKARLLDAVAASGKSVDEILELLK